MKIMILVLGAIILVAGAGCIGMLEGRTESVPIYAKEDMSDEQNSDSGADYAEPFVETIIVEGTTMAGGGVDEPILGLIGMGNWVLPFNGKFEINPGCTGIIAIAEGETIDQATSFKFNIKDTRYTDTAGVIINHTGNSWQAEGESLPLEIRIPVEGLVDYPDGETFELDIDAYGIELQSEYRVTIDVYYGIPLP